MHMRTTLILDDELLARASDLSGIEGKTAVVHAGLHALVAKESAKRLAALGGTEKALRPVRRRRLTESSRSTRP
jgi:Arc/MetJ family transcription regulator